MTPAELDAIEERIRRESEALPPHADAWQVPQCLTDRQALAVEVRRLQVLAGEAGRNLRSFWTDDGGCAPKRHAPDECPTGWCGTLDLAERCEASCPTTTSSNS